MNAAPYAAGLALMFLLGPGLLTAQEDQRPALRAIRVTEAPLLDGDVLNDPVWQAVPHGTQFWQTEPDDGQPASEETEVRVIYTGDTLFIGVVCRDRQPQEMITSGSRRDGSLSETDSFQIILDTFHDGQNGFVFGTNPAGLEYDGQVVNEGRGSGSPGSGAGGGFNLNWDGSWDVETDSGQEGWSAEFAIPFRTLRYPDAAEQDWGINFQRNLRRRNETSYWSRLPRQFSLHRLSLAGSLTGVAPPPQRNLKLVPYALGDVSRAGVAGAHSSVTGEQGLDLKYSLTPSMTLDATYNTDFAQVEADEEQINLNRFNLFFPEKRPFFLENAGLFAVGNAGEIDLFFSRRIGIGADGENIPILGGARVSGKAGRTGLGFLNMQTEDLDGVTDGNNWTAARIRTELPRRSYVGFLATNRQSTGGAPGLDMAAYNRVFAVDGEVGIGEVGQISGFVSRSLEPDGGRHPYAYSFEAQRDSKAWLLRLAYAEVGEGFNPELGFLSRSGYRNPDALIFYRYRPRHFWNLQEIRPHASYSGFWDFSGFQETGFLHLDNHWEWKGGAEVHTAVNFTREGIKQAFELAPGIFIPPGTYDNDEVALVAMTNQGAPLSISVRTTVGGFFTGDRVAMSPTVRWRNTEKFTGELGWSYNDINLPEGNFDTNLGRLRLSYSFSPRIFIENLMQYNDRAGAWSTNLRFGWLQTANIGLFVVYNDTRGIGMDGPEIPDRSFIVKYSRQFDLLR